MIFREPQDCSINGPGERHIDSGVTPVGPPLNPRAFEARTGAKLWEFNTGDRSWLVSN